MKPTRIVLSRRAGFDLQAISQALNGLPAQSVARPGPWGNPFTVAEVMEETGSDLLRGNGGDDDLSGYRGDDERSQPHSRRGLHCSCPPGWWRRWWSR